MSNLHMGKQMLSERFSIPYCTIPMHTLEVTRFGASEGRCVEHENVHKSFGIVSIYP